jgi:hypothetical protein
MQNVTALKKPQPERAHLNDLMHRGSLRRIEDSNGNYQFQRTENIE